MWFPKPKLQYGILTGSVPALRARIDIYVAALPLVTTSVSKSPFDTGQLRHAESGLFVVEWNGESEVEPHCFIPDGTAVLSQADGQVCILKLHHGNRRVSLGEAEEFLRAQGRVKREEG